MRLSIKFPVGSKLLFLFFLCNQNISAQENIEVGESMEDYIKENHVDNLEKIVHKLASSEIFLKKLLEEGHDINTETKKLKRKDVAVGKDIDVYVKHFTEHQNFTMFLIPINFYSYGIYDTLLISVLEVSDHWLKQNHYYYDIENDSIKSSLLSKDNHDLLGQHMTHQALNSNRINMAEVEVKLHETYVSNNTLHLSLSKLTAKEKKEFTEFWGMMKKLLTHNVDLNAELNMYVFGTDDMEIEVTYRNNTKTHRITPGNIFTRHHFQEDF